MTPLENILHWTVVALFGLGVLGYMSAFGLHLASVNAPSRRLAWNWMGLAPVGAAFLALVGLLLARGLHLGSIPFQSKYETFLIMMAGLAVGFVAFDLGGGLRKIKGWPGMWVALIGASAAGTGLVFALLSRQEDFQALQKPPALQTYWIAIHTPCMIVSYGLLYVAVATAGLYLALRGFTGRDDVGGLDWDHLVHSAMKIGFPFLTVGLFLGCVWGQEAWATYWGWDIKETWAFITWAVFLVYFHLRMTPGMKGMKSALVVVLGGAAILVTWLCMHLLPESVSSLHVYN
jgi:ABC-type transport system involved in cytochrome c biogenesis permease subunit